MKPLFLIPPSVALVLAAAWNFAQMRSISSLEEDRATLLDGIAAASNYSGSAMARNHRRSKPANPVTGVIDWNFFATAFVADEGTVGGTRKLIEFQRRLVNMTPHEMADALDEIASQDMSAYGRRRLEYDIMKKLIELDPELALTRFADHVGERYGVGVPLPDAFSKWANIDPAAATEWFDKQIADGRFDRKSLDDLYDMRRIFEGKLMTSLLEIDPGHAARRISSLPEDQRAGVLKSIEIRNPSREFSAAYGNFVRNLVPAHQQEECFAYVGHWMRPDLEDSFSQADRFLESAKATPAERIAALVAAGEMRIKHFRNSPDAVEKIMEYYQANAPEQADSMVGSALAGSTQMAWAGRIPFKDAIQAAQRYHETSGSDEVLVAFLEKSAAASDPMIGEDYPLMIELARKIQDDAQRTQVLQKLDANRNRP